MKLTKVLFFYLFASIIAQFNFFVDQIIQFLIKLTSQFHDSLPIFNPELFLCITVHRHRISNGYLF